MFKKMKKLLAGFLALTMCVGMISTTAYAEEATGAQPVQIVKEGGKIYYGGNGADAASATNYDVWTSKTIAETGTENEFEITLQVGSTKKAKSEDVAVLLVMDASTSMLNDKEGKKALYSTGWKDYIPVEGPLRIDYAREAAEEFVSGLVDHAGDASVKIAMVEFGNNAKTVLDWTEANNAGTVNADIINSIQKFDVGFSIDESDAADYDWYKDIAEASFWAPVRDESGRCYYVKEDGNYCELTDPFHTHNSKNADLCYWIAREESYIDCSYTGCTNCTDHNHSLYDCWTDGSCSFEGCTSTSDSHTHTTYDRWNNGTCSYPECKILDKDSHTHKVYDYWKDGTCSYPDCTSTTDSHTHSVYDYWEDGTCSYPDCTSTTDSHTHNVYDYWVEGACSYPDCTNTTNSHIHEVDCWTDGFCRFEGCTDTTDSHTHDVNYLVDDSCTFEGCTNLDEHVHPVSYWTPGTCSFEGCTDTTDSHTHDVDYWVEASCIFEGCTNSKKHTHSKSYWTPGACSFEGCTKTSSTKKSDHKHNVLDYWTPGTCKFKDCKNTTSTKKSQHKHDVLDYWTPGTCSFENCTNTTGKKHKHHVLDYWTPGTCSYEGCTEIKKHKHGLYFLKCNYVDENGETCTGTDYHTHQAEGHCTYSFDNTPCTNTTPFHYHKFTLSDANSSYDTFAWYTDGRMFDVRYLLTDDKGVNHLCVDYESLRFHGSGTNMEGGLRLARNLVNAGKADGGAINGIDNVYVILLSDGCPTYHVQDQLTNVDTEVKFLPGERGGGSYAQWNDLKDIVSDGTAGDVAIAEDIKAVSDFYAIMYGTEMGQKLGYTSGGAHYGGHALGKTTALEWFQTSNDFENGKSNYVGAHEVFVSTEADKLNTVFANIKDRIDVIARAWTVADELSDEVTFEEFTLNGEYAKYDEDNHAITWYVGDMNPEKADAAGTVEDPYVYTMKYKVKLDPEFVGVYKASVAGTGVNTNKGASLYYLMTDDGEDLNKMPYDELVSRAKEVAFDHPAVKAFYADYTFTKLASATDIALEGAGFTVYKDGKAWTDEAISDASGKVSFEKLSAGSYKLVESTVPADMQEMDPMEFVVSYGKLLQKDGSAMPTKIYNDSLVPDSAVTLTIDMSGTMYRYKMDGKRYVDVAKAKALDFVNQYADSATSGKDLRMLAIASFDTDAKVVLNWVDVNTASGLAAAKKAINAMKVADNGSTSSNQVCTNFDAGVILTRNMMKLDAVKDIEKKFAIILSDGAPTVTVNEDTDAVGTIKSSFWGDQKDEWGKTYQIRRYGGGWTHPAEVARTLRYLGTGSNNLSDLTVNYRTEEGGTKEGIFIVGVGGDMSFKLFNDAVNGTSNGSRSADVKKKPAAFNNIDALADYNQTEIMKLTAGNWMGILADKVNGTYESANNSAALQSEFAKIIEVIKDVTNP